MSCNAPIYKRGQSLSFSIFERQTDETLTASLKPSMPCINPIEAIPVAVNFSVAEITDETRGDGWLISLTPTQTNSLAVGTYAYDAKILNGGNVVITATDYFNLIDRVTV